MRQLLCRCHDHHHSIYCHYTIHRGSIYEEDPEYPELKAKYDKMILEDQFIDLTLTYDFEQDEAPKPTKQQKKKAAQSHLLGL